jgi:hypothetical protein
MGQTCACPSGRAPLQRSSPSGSTDASECGHNASVQVRTKRSPADRRSARLGCSGSMQRADEYAVVRCGQAFGPAIPTGSFGDAPVAFVAFLFDAFLFDAVLFDAIPPKATAEPRLRGTLDTPRGHRTARIGCGGRRRRSRFARAHSANRCAARRSRRRCQPGPGTLASSSTRHRLLDAMLPEVYVFDICSTLKGGEAWSMGPRVMFSDVFRGFANTKLIQEPHGAGAILDKPFDVRCLRHVVATLWTRAAACAPDEHDVHQVRTALAGWRSRACPPPCAGQAGPLEVDSFVARWSPDPSTVLLDVLPPRRAAPNSVWSRARLFRGIEPIARPVPGAWSRSEVFLTHRARGSLTASSTVLRPPRAWTAGRVAEGT